MNKYGQSSIWDSLIKIMPELRNKIVRSPDYVDSTAAKNLFSVWRTGENKSSEKIYKRPTALAHNDLEQMKKAGLIRVLGDNIEITEKGAKVINIMILGDDRSSFEDNDIIIDYNQALDTTKGLKTANKKFIK